MGIAPYTWIIECPFKKENVDAETLSWFKEEIKKIYIDFAETQLELNYDFEI